MSAINWSGYLSSIGLDNFSFYVKIWILSDLDVFCSEPVCFKRKALIRNRSKNSGWKIPIRFVVIDLSSSNLFEIVQISNPIRICFLRFWIWLFLRVVSGFGQSPDFLLHYKYAGRISGLSGQIPSHHPLTNWR